MQQETPDPFDDLATILGFLDWPRPRRNRLERIAKTSSTQKFKMNCIIKRPGNPITEEDLRQVEMHCNVVFPSDYRRLMLEHNGGMPEPCVFVSDEGFEVQVLVLFHVIDNYPYDLLRESFCSDWPEALEQGIVCIGRDAGGSSILLCTREDAGAIYFLDREETLRPPQGAVRIANSFTELMSGLR